MTLISMIYFVSNKSLKYCYRIEYRYLGSFFLIFPQSLYSGNGYFVGRLLYAKLFVDYYRR